MSESEQNPPDTTISRMSHEVRTPLTSIMGFAELLLEDESLTGTQRDYLQTINDEAKRLAGMLNHYLSVLSVEEGRNKEDQV